MAKESMKAREKRRMKLVEKYDAKRAQLKQKVILLGYNYYHQIQIQSVFTIDAC